MISIILYYWPLKRFCVGPKQVALGEINEQLSSILFEKRYELRLPFRTIFFHACRETKHKCSFEYFSDLPTLNALHWRDNALTNKTHIKMNLQTDNLFNCLCLHHKNEMKPTVTFKCAFSFLKMATTAGTYRTADPFPLNTSITKDLMLGLCWMAFCRWGFEKNFWILSFWQKEGKFLVTR